MEVGQTFSRTEYVVFYSKSTCAKVAEWEPGSSNLIKFVDFHSTWINNGIALNNVAEFIWIINGVTEERYFYAKNLGLVKWANRAGLESSIWELVPHGSQQNNVRGKWCNVS